MKRVNNQKVRIKEFEIFHHKGVIDVQEKMFEVPFKQYTVCGIP